jgi:hypothetical protein
MPRRTSALTAALAAAALAGGILPAAASAGDKPTDAGKSASAGSKAPVVTGRPDADADGRKNG